MIQRRCATGSVLAKADATHQHAVVGEQRAGRIGFYLRVEDFDASYARMRSAP